MKVISDGTSEGTEIIDLETERPISNVRKLTFIVEAGEPSTIQIELNGMELEFEGDVDVKRARHND